MSFIINGGSLATPDPIPDGFIFGVTRDPAEQVEFWPNQPGSQDYDPGGPPILESESVSGAATAAYFDSSFLVDMGFGPVTQSGWTTQNQ